MRYFLFFRLSAGEDGALSVNLLIKGWVFLQGLVKSGQKIIVIIILT